jgi:adenosine deaminase
MGGSSNTTEDSSVILHEFITNAPKIELHAHLNGCIREATLFELAKERSVALNDQHFANTQTVDQDRSMYNVRPRSLQDCFDMFAEIPKCVDDLDALARITTEALEDFALHHVVYLELRSTPKQLLVKTGQHAKIVSKQTYCLTILNCMKDFEHQEQERFHSEFDSGLSKCRLPMTCRFIVSVDRSQSAEVAIEHIELAASLRREYGDYVVGVDLGGNPTKVRTMTLNDWF